ncbi:mitochondrial sodium/calcium exchanger protein [Drosophila takahashii]|uniref:mitochondrial sodium/calcium exchanger protein n=1 Tax=Drosophila takahashii TaxID=29030 RepID=UPI001CF92592|nr:mitochondrial sodium/calcium exchanger protein [Drosophila takahashii]
MEFVNLSAVTRCALPQELYRNTSQICGLARSTISCRSFVFLINYLDIFFCSFKLPTISIYGLISAFLLMAYFSLLFMLTKYFFMPNFVTLIEFAPMTMFGFSFLVFGPSIFLSFYNSAWMICDPQKNHLSRLQFAKMVGDIIRYFVFGVMALSAQGYRAEGVTLWSCMSFILTGMGYLYIVTKKSYHIELMDTDLYLIKFRVTVFLYTFALVLLVIMVVSHATFQRSLLRNTPKSHSYMDMESGDEILGKYPKQRVFSRRQLWLKTINGYENMKDSHLVYRVLMIPIFFLVSNFFPVICKDRFLVGWNKYVNCLCLIFLPFICLPHGFKAFSWLIILLVCWALGILTSISTHSLRRPDNVWLLALLGLIISSVAMNLLSREIENITWQYVSIHFDVMPDVTALMYFGLGEMFSEVIIVRCLQQRKLWDATFGVVMSMVTYAIFLAFPLLFYQGCYHPSCSLITTASTETGIHFVFLIVSTTLLHISMSGYEFRISLFFYLLTLTVIYVTLQWMIHYDWMLSLATLHIVKPKN